MLYECDLICPIASQIDHAWNNALTVTHAESNSKWNLITFNKNEDILTIKDNFMKILPLIQITHSMMST